MNLKDILAVSGMSGLYKLSATRGNGLVVEDLETGKTQFCSVRKHQFTPMETVAIYTMADTIEIRDVFRRMLEQLEDNPPVDTKAPQADIKDYFEDIIPEYDKDRVYVSDMKKVIKWFNYLNNKGYLAEDDDSTQEEE